MSGPFPPMSDAPDLPLPDDPDSFREAAYPFTVFMHGLPAQVNAVSAAYAAWLQSMLTATSSSSIAAGVGTKSADIGDGFAFAPGMRVICARTSDPVDVRMAAIVTSYAAGVLEFTVPAGGATGSGTFTDWSISPSAEATPQELVIQSGKSGGYVTVLGDANSVIPLNSGGATIDGSVAWSKGASLTFKERGGASQTIAISSGTMKLDESGATGSRTLLPYGTAFAWYDEEVDTWWIGGSVT